MLFTFMEESWASGQVSCAAVLYIQELRWSVSASPIFTHSRLILALTCTSKRRGWAWDIRLFLQARHTSHCTLNRKGIRHCSSNVLGVHLPISVMLGCYNTLHTILANIYRAFIMLESFSYIVNMY